MEQIIKDIQRIFIEFNNLNFQIDIESKKVLDFDFEKMNYSFYNEINQIEHHLQLIYLQGNDLTLHRVKAELLKIESTLKNVDFGFDIQVNPYNFKVLIEPEIVTKINELKLNYTKQLLEFIEKFLPPQQTETEQETPTFTNNFDKITPTEIYKHFKAGLVEKQYLTEQELNEFLKVAFELKTIPETLFKIKDAPNKATIEAVFYKYYKNVAGKIHGKQNQYAALLGDYFEGYKTTTVSSNFSKSVY